MYIQAKHLPRYQVSGYATTSSSKRNHQTSNNPIQNLLNNLRLIY